MRTSRKLPAELLAKFSVTLIVRPWLNKEETKLKKKKAYLDKMKLQINWQIKIQHKESVEPPQEARIASGFCKNGTGKMEQNYSKLFSMIWLNLVTSTLY